VFLPIIHTYSNDDSKRQNQLIPGFFGGVRVAHHFSFLCCVGFFFYLSLFCFFCVCVQEKFEDTKRVIEEGQTPQ
jgi:hypothetical protein